MVVSGTNSQVQAQFDFSPGQLGFYVSCVLWGCAIGSGFAGPIADAFGRKKTLMLAAVMIFISATWSGLASGPMDLIMARLLGGFGIGAATMVCPLYISEIAPEKHRGRMVTLFQFTITIGIVMCVFANWGIFNFADFNSESETISDFMKWFAVDQNWRAMFFAEALPGVLFLICAFFIPESPRWLVKRKRGDEAEMILSKVNGIAKSKVIRAEIESTLSDEGGVRFLDLFSDKLKRPLILSLLLCFFAEACGVSVVFYYGPQILEDAGFGLGGSLGGFATIAIVNLVATIVALVFVDSAGRKKLLTFGTIGAMVAHIVIGTLFFNEVTGWPIVIAINAFVAFFACAIGPVKFILISEIFPNRIRGQAISLATVCIWMTSASVAQLFPTIREHLPTGAIFYFFAFVLFLSLWVIKYLMPETKGRTIEEIERSWFEMTK